MEYTEKKEYAKLEDTLFFAGTIYESFEALEETMGKLKLERPLFLIYLAKKAFAEEVLNAAGEHSGVETMETVIFPSSPAENKHYDRLQ